MLKAPLSWLIAALLVTSIYYFYLRRRTRTRFFPFFFRRRSRTRASAFQFQLFDLHPQPLFSSGLDSASIAALPIDQYAALKVLTEGRVPSECAVCLSPFEEDDTLRFIPACIHGFHVECLDPWIANHSTCPTCRATLLLPLPTSESTLPLSQLAESQNPNDVVLTINENLRSQEEASTLGTPPKALWAHFWRQRAPLRLKIHVCRVLSGTFPTDRRRRCTICGGGTGETSEHLFFQCPAARALWYEFWGIKTDGEETAGWTTANWVEATLYPGRFMGLKVEEEGEMFLFAGCLMDRVWGLRNRVVEGEEDEVGVDRMKLAVGDSFWELRSAFIVHAAADHKV